ncbi:MAG TPA: class I SAM-dependent methyltransferase [Eubacteriales bacterium]|nr:class I SAM-dependent methyltransferase [Eubacteriales bacterium]
MKRDVQTVKTHYDENPEAEWLRLERHPFEFILTTYMMDRFIRPGESILDIGGGPGRYAVHYAKLGCPATLVDLSDGNASFALEQAKKADVSIEAYAKNCLELEELGLGQFDHVFLMGPLYHLTERADQTRAVQLALNHLKPGGCLYVSFILAFAGILFDLKYGGNIVRDASNPETRLLIDAISAGEDYRGAAFTSVCFTHQRNILPFMEQFPLIKLSLFGQEGILAPNEADLLTREKAELDCWISLAEKYLEVPELLSLSEHAMYIGRKNI